MMIIVIKITMMIMKEKERKQTKIQTRTPNLIEAIFFLVTAKRLNNDR